MVLSSPGDNHEAMAQMMEKIAFRQGIGDILAEGIVKASKHFGKEAEKYVSHSKGMVMAGMDSRIMKGTSLGFATSTRGACHLTASSAGRISCLPGNDQKRGRGAIWYR